MEIHLLEGDGDFLCGRAGGVDELHRLDMYDLDGVDLDTKSPAHLTFDADSPFSEAVATDCPYSAISRSLLLSELAVLALGSMLKQAGVIYDVEGTGAKGYKLFLCTCRIDALIEERSDLTRFDSGRVHEVKRHELRREMLEGVDVFCLKDDRVSLYVSDRFVRTIDEHQLTGFKNAMVWSDTEGGIVIDPRSPFGAPRPWAVDLEKEPERLRKKRRAMRALIEARDSALADRTA